MNVIRCTPLICLLLTLSACQKGDPGETGPQGPAGNANVVTHVCTWTSASFGTQGTGEHRVFDCAAPNITQAIIDHGAVFGFLRMGTGWRQLPFTRVIAANANTTLEYQGSYSIGNYNVRVSELGGNGTLTDAELDLFNGGNYELQVVAIAGSSALPEGVLQALAYDALHGNHVEGPQCPSFIQRVPTSH